ncbi:MAG TPA: hypothetical protein VNT79_10460 [Phycisphaerae bacterium]|nr:hypothetical protein [Phycisphaerae bacterium]
MFEIHKKIVTDENARPIAVQIDYADWLEIERRLAASSNGGDSPPSTPAGDKRRTLGRIEGEPLSETIIHDRR